MNKLIFIELANIWKTRADIVENFPTEEEGMSEANKKTAESRLFSLRI